jgi:hypothetical protein
MSHCWGYGKWVWLWKMGNMPRNIVPNSFYLERKITKKSGGHLLFLYLMWKKLMLRKINMIHLSPLLAIFSKWFLLFLRKYFFKKIKSHLQNTLFYTTDYIERNLVERGLLA